jgi:hypothetical protein
LQQFDAFSSIAEHGIGDRSGHASIGELVQGRRTVDIPEFAIEVESVQGRNLLDREVFGCLDGSEPGNARLGFASGSLAAAWASAKVLGVIPA